jgi:hypothetical protein
MYIYIVWKKSSLYYPLGALTYALICVMKDAPPWGWLFIKNLDVKPLKYKCLIKKSDHMRTTYLLVLMNRVFISDRLRRLV